MKKIIKKHKFKKEHVIYDTKFKGHHHNTASDWFTCLYLSLYLNQF